MQNMFGTSEAIDPSEVLLIGFAILLKILLAHCAKQF